MSHPQLSRPQENHAQIFSACRADSRRWSTVFESHHRLFPAKKSHLPQSDCREATKGAVKKGAHGEHCRFSCLTKLCNSVINYQHLVRSKIRHDVAYPTGWVIFLRARDLCHERFLVAANQQSARSHDSGVVQQAGHAALDRRIGVRIPAPECPAVGIEIGFVHLLACPGSR
jgi:hypothetical protein